MQQAINGTVNSEVELHLNRESFTRFYTGFDGSSSFSFTKTRRSKLTFGEISQLVRCPS